MPGQPAAPAAGGGFLCSENHSLGEWFKKRLMSIMAK